jgi:hypothetical protein
MTWMETKSLIWESNFDLHFDFEREKSANGEQVSIGMSIAFVLPQTSRHAKKFLR